MAEELENKKTALKQAIKNDQFELASLIREDILTLEVRLAL